MLERCLWRVSTIFQRLSQNRQTKHLSIISGNFGIIAQFKKIFINSKSEMPKRTDIHKILIIGSGPIVIGQACEFDYS
ncbi:MAG: hypothetical protein M3T96_07470, partial [Acidobacteriota bacterium]|nr:hypothetical protein [Acidobacteriota bacterium]